MGKKIIDLVTRRAASWGRKSKGGGGEIIKGYGTIYTPAMKVADNAFLRQILGFYHFHVKFHCAEGRFTIFYIALITFPPNYVRPVRDRRANRQKK